MASNVVVCCCLAAVVAVWVQAVPEDKLDSVNVDEVLNNERLMQSYMQCVLSDSDAKCTNEGRIPGLVKSGCSECTPKQLERAVKVLKHVTVKHPEEWAKMKAKFDPTGEYTKKYADFWKKLGIDF